MVKIPPVTFFKKKFGKPNVKVEIGKRRVCTECGRSVVLYDRKNKKCVCLECGHEWGE